MGRKLDQSYRPGVGLDQVPAQPVACRAQPVRAGGAIVLRGVAVVPGGGQQVEPPAVAPPVGRAFEARRRRSWRTGGPGMRSPARRTARALPSSLRSQAMAPLLCRERTESACATCPATAAPAGACRWPVAAARAWHRGPAPGRRPGPCCSSGRWRGGRRSGRRGVWSASFWYFRNSSAFCGRGTG